MKKRIYMSLLLFMLLVAAGAQTLNDQYFDEEALLERIGVDEAVIERIREMNLQALISAREAGADQRILQARLEKLLLNPEPDMQLVEALLRESLELKLLHEQSRIKSSLEKRKLLGEQQWLQLLRERRVNRARTGGLPAGNDPAETRASNETRDSGSSGSGDSSGGSGSGRK